MNKVFGKKKANYKWILTATLLFLIVAVFLSLRIGTVTLSLQEICSAVVGGSNTMAGRIFWFARLPRTVASALAGAALAVSGVVIQNVLTNKLASPSIIGVNSGAGLAVTICCACGALSGWAIAGSAFLGALLAVCLVSLTAEKIGASKTTVILGGVAINSFFNAASEAISTVMPEVAMLSGDFRVGGFSSVAYTRVLPAGVLILLSILVIFSLHNELDIIALGEDTAQGLGLSVKKMRVIFLGLSAMLAGAAVSFAGLLGFVGLIIPHLGRALVGSENRKLIPFCGIFGAAFVTLCDLIARMLFSPYEISAGILMSFIGGPFFIFILLKKRGVHS